MKNQLKKAQMVKYIFKTFIFTLLYSTKIFACINGETLELKDGTFLYEDNDGNVPYGHDYFQNDYSEHINYLDSLYNVTKDLDYLSDKGILLILSKKYQEAVNLYLKIEKLAPNRYSTASNIGTAYELLGQNENALKWIKRAVQIDPKSHKNSEWIHVKILEAKIKGDKYITTYYLLNTDFGMNKNPITKLNKVELEKLSDELFFQLNERVSFFKPKDKIVAQLLYDLGNIAFILNNYHDALDDYKQAQLYGYKGDLITQRINDANILSKKTIQSKKTNISVFENLFLTNEILLFAVITVLILIFYYLKIRKK